MVSVVHAHVAAKMPSERLVGFVPRQRNNEDGRVIAEVGVVLRWPSVEKLELLERGQQGSFSQMNHRTYRQRNRVRGRTVVAFEYECRAVEIGFPEEAPRRFTSCSHANADPAR